MKYKIALFLILFVSMPAMAQCHLDGQVYEEGARVGDYTCRNGQWI